MRVKSSAIVLYKIEMYLLGAGDRHDPCRAAPLLTTPLAKKLLKNFNY